jgi:hypothetical protein
MDFIYLFLVIVLFGASLGFVRVCERVRGQT